MNYSKTHNDTKGIRLLIKQYVPVVLLLLFVLVEFNTKYFIYQGEASGVQKYTKGIICIGLLIGVLAKAKVNLKSLALLGLLTGFFAIGQLDLEPSFTAYNTISFARFLFPIVLFLFFYNYTPTIKGKQLLFKGFEWLLALNFLLIVLGVVFEVYELKTYTGQRFGYNGLFITSSTSSYVYFIALGYYYFVYKQKALKQWRFWVVLISCLLIGTKSLYLGLVLFAGLWVVGSTVKYKKPLLVLSAIVLSVMLYVVLYQVEAFAQIREQDGVLSALLSYRDHLFLNDTLPYIQDHWSAVNYLFGGVSDFTLRSQMDFIDVFFFWGIMGGVLYLFTFGRSYFTFKLERTHWVYFISLALIVFLAGNFFAYTSVPLYLIVLREALNDA